MYIFVFVNPFVLLCLRKIHKTAPKKNCSPFFVSEVHAQGFHQEQSYVSTGWEGWFCDGGHGWMFIF